MSRKKSKVTMRALAEERKQLFDAQCELFKEEFDQKIVDAYEGALKDAREEGGREMTITIRDGLYGWMKEGLLLHGLTVFFIKSLWSNYLDDIPDEEYDSMKDAIKQLVIKELFK